ncbi:MAG: 50S ribosomal protein L22 [Candidatus Omnitrophica bacterium]|nr:50S ribosomal protein L22 [Candidatus Omnitrophota bacterium]MBU4589400.1 50S ribosomal protein L22 [Candidatus Omnitrophota bacterium]
MVTRVIARYIRISPRKTRRVANLIKGMPAVKAEALLDTIEQRPRIYIKRLLRSALDSADKKAHLSPADLYISSIKSDQGPSLKRFRAATMGRASMIKHRTTHITLELDRIVRPVKKEVASEKVKGEGLKVKAKAKEVKTEAKKRKAVTKKPK